MTRHDYDTLARELAALELSSGLYLADENVDRENCIEAFPDQELAADPAPFWSAMIYAACSAAGQRAEDGGADINEMLGRIIY